MPSFLTPVALGVVALSAVYLLLLGAASLFVPSRTSRFLLGFAASPSVHFLEMFLRLVAGAALVIYAPNMQFSGAFSAFGWLLLVTTAGLLLVPWHWHRSFAQSVVPRFTRYVSALGLVSLSLGGVIVYAVVSGDAA